MAVASQSGKTGQLTAYHTLNVFPEKNEKSVARMPLLVEECGAGDLMQCQRGPEGKWEETSVNNEAKVEVKRIIVSITCLHSAAPLKCILFFSIKKK